MAIATENLLIPLQKFFGFDKFKGKQEEIIRSVLEGRDTFVIMPTGGGKSLCYQLPALMMPGTAIVISPLIALMKNQVDAIRGYSDEDEVAHFLNSSLTKAQIKIVKQDILDGKTKLLYIAPETLTKEENIEFLKGIPLSFIAVDEAHCISEWGHDFRPEYRRIRSMIDDVNKDIPIIALTATATPKVRTDIVKNLNMRSERNYVLSFNRDNLYYEVRPKSPKMEQTVKSILQVIMESSGKCGIIYVQSRKSAEDIAKMLAVNGIKALAYHAGLDAKTRSKTQDDFLMEEIDVIVATIAFGMGIDKPDVRFVIHYDIPKSIENYYQETGRGGRDGLDGRCVAFYSEKDVTRLEKFLRDKPAAEREMGMLLMQEITAYAETTACRRQFLLHYFGEDYDDDRCNKMCDNCKHPKVKIDVTQELQQALQAVVALNENYVAKILVDFLRGKDTKEMDDYGFSELDLFGIGDEKDEHFWNSIYRHALITGFLDKDIEKYGTLTLTAEGRKFLENPTSFSIPINRNFDEENEDLEESSGKTAVLDEVLIGMLRDLTKRVGKKMDVPPYVVFQEPSLMDMATQYPITLEDLEKCSGVSKGKAQKYGKEFVNLIKTYVEDNEIERPTDFVLKTVANKSKVKVAIIQGIDRKIPLPDLAETNHLTWEEFIEELDSIVISGTKLNLDYYLKDTIDEYVREDIYNYFMESHNDSEIEAYHALKEDDITMEEIQLVRIKFLSEMAN